MRFFRIVGAYLLSVLSAAVSLSLMLNLSASFEESLSFGSVFLTGVILTIPFIGAFSFAQAVCFIVFAEVFRVRSWLFYAFAGATSVILATAWIFADADRGPRDPTFVAMLVVSGMAAGLTYWLIAGRSAGSWTREPRHEV